MSVVVSNARYRAYSFLIHACKQSLRHVCIYILDVEVTVPVLDLEIIVTNTRNCLYILKTNQEAEKSARRRTFSDILNQCKQIQDMNLV